MSLARTPRPSLRRWTWWRWLSVSPRVQTISRLCAHWRATRVRWRERYASAGQPRAPGALSAQGRCTPCATSKRICANAAEPAQTERLTIPGDGMTTANLTTGEERRDNQQAARRLDYDVLVIGAG